jgi:hypothetical protein
MSSPEQFCRQIHQMLEQLPILRNPSRIHFENGLYFFYEDGETSSPASSRRIVRIGNHTRSQNTLKKRPKDALLATRIAASSGNSLEKQYSEKRSTTPLHSDRTWAGTLGKTRQTSLQHVQTHRRQNLQSATKPFPFPLYRGHKHGPAQLPREVTHRNHISLLNM